MNRVITSTLATIIAAPMLLILVTQGSSSPPDDQSITNGWFFSQTGDGSGNGYSVTNESDIPYWTFFQEAGGVQSLGYPVSRRWGDGSFTYQAFQKAVLQWQPGKGMFYANTYDQLSMRGYDPWLDAFRSTPPPQAFPEDEGKPFETVKQNHLRLLDHNVAIKAEWYKNSNWLDAYGLPVSYSDLGDVRVLRAQRAVFQQWMVATAWAMPGEVVVSNGGDIYKESGLIPSAAVGATSISYVATSPTPVVIANPSLTPNPSETPSTMGTTVPALPTETPTMVPAPTAQAGSITMPSIAAIPLNVPAYNRSDWRHWTDDDKDCQNARHEVLIAESQIPVVFKSTESCQVATGEWWAAFTDVIIRKSSELDVDHFVPLKNAHLSGGWAWDAATKRRYANALSDPTHLIAVTASANRSKGAKAPDQWKPSNRAYWCTYAITWIGIKNTWELTVTKAEASALTDMLGTCRTAINIIETSISAATDPVPTPEPTPSPLPVATATPFPQPTPTPSPVATQTENTPSGPSPEAIFEIVALDCLGKPESVTIRNVGGGPGSLEGWLIHDDGSKHSFVFGSEALLNAGSDITLWSWTGASTKIVFWTGRAVWNNTGDTAYLLNPSGTIIGQLGCS